MSESSERDSRRSGENFRERKTDNISRISFFDFVHPWNFSHLSHKKTLWYINGAGRMASFLQGLCA
jgi:hypothetical protein